MNGAKFEIIKILLDKDVDNRTINVTNQFGHLPLHVYRNGGSSGDGGGVGGGNFEIIKLLLDKELERKIMLKMNEMDNKLNQIQNSVANLEQHMIKSLQESLKTILEGGEVMSKRNNGSSSKSMSGPKRPAGRRPEGD